MPNHALITRKESTDFGTFGTLKAYNWDNESLELITLELPWRMNKRMVSCIPRGIYQCVWHKSPSKGWCYKVFDVPGRSAILIHPGNWAGDIHKGYHTDLKGCIALGLDIDAATPPNGKHGKQAMVTHSRKACEQFRAFFNSQPFELEIQ